MYCCHLSHLSSVAIYYIYLLSTIVTCHIYHYHLLLPCTRTGLTYSPADVSGLVEYARVRGVQLLVEVCLSVCTGGVCVCVCVCVCCMRWLYDWADNVQQLDD